MNMKNSLRKLLMGNANYSNHLMLQRSVNICIVKNNVLI